MASPWERLYWSSPLWLQQTAVAAWGVGWYLRRYGPQFHRLVREFRERDAWDIEQFHAYQERRLAKVFEAAWNSPFYHARFCAAGITPKMAPWDALARLPLLSKQTAREWAKDMLTTNRLPWRTKVFNTSGSTGTPMGVYYTPEFHMVQSAVAEVRSLNIGGATYRSRRFMCAGRKVCRFEETRPPFWRQSPIENLAYASSYHLAPQFLPHYVDFLRGFRPQVLMGYPSALSTIARFMVQENVSLPSPLMAVTSAETVGSETRSVIETAFQCRLFDRYGAAEGCVFAGQCEFGRYHVSPELGIIEIINERGKPCAPGELGEIVCTGLQNLLQPFIRYRIGDAARWARNQQCRCGRKTPILEQIEGRMDAMLYTADGRRVGRVDHIFKGVHNVKEAQVRQERIHRFVISVVPEQGFGGNDIKQLQDNMRLHVGAVEVQVQSVPSIPRTAAGKFRAVVCDLSEEERSRLGSLRISA